jgi:hypothetical protein
MDVLMNNEQWTKYERCKAEFVHLWPDCPFEIYEKFILSLAKRLGL